MANYNETATGPVFKDRKTGLVVFGILEILFGALCALLMLLTVLGAVVSASLEKNSGSHMSLNMIMPAVLLYAVMAVWFICTGIGSINARRWARALLLVSSWLWLLSGISGLIFLMLAPDMYKQMAENGEMSQRVAEVMRFVMLGFMTVFYIIIPGALVLFYGSKNVKATCEFRDQHVRWTDKCPLPVLAVSMVSVIGMASMLLMGFYGWAMPFFGRILGGNAGAAVGILSTLLLGCVAVGTYRLSMKAWWCAIFATIAWGLSTVITFRRVNLGDFYEKMNFPEQQLEIMKQYEYGVSQPVMNLFIVVWGVAFLGYLIYARRYFKLAHEPLNRWDIESSACP